MKGFILNGVYNKNEDEKNQLRMGGGSWTINLTDLTGEVTLVRYYTGKGMYEIPFYDAVLNGFERTFVTNDRSEKKLVVPIKFWKFKAKHDTTKEIQKEMF